MRYIFTIFVFSYLIGPPVVAARILWIRVSPSILPTFCPEFFLRWAHKFFLKLSMVLEAHMLLCVMGPDFFEKFSYCFFLNLVYKESLYYLLYSCINPIFWKNLVLRYAPKCSWPIRLQYFKTDYISRTKWWKILIFCILVQIHRN